MANILLMDDNEPLCRLVKRTLELSGEHTVECVGDGEVGMTLFEQDLVDYDLIILDISMPRMDGWEVLRILRERDSGYAGKIIMLSDHNEPEDFLKSTILGADGYLTKPFDTVQLLRMVYQCFARSEAST